MVGLLRAAAIITVLLGIAGAIALWPQQSLVYAVPERAGQCEVLSRYLGWLDEPIAQCRRDLNVAGLILPASVIVSALFSALIFAALAHIAEIVERRA